MNGGVMKNTSMAIRLLATLMTLMLLTVLSGCESHSSKVEILKANLIAADKNKIEIPKAYEIEFSRINAQTQAIYDQCANNKKREDLAIGTPEQKACEDKIAASYNLAAKLEIDHRNQMIRVNIDREISFLKWDVLKNNG